MNECSSSFSRHIIITSHTHNEGENTTQNTQIQIEHTSSLSLASSLALLGHRCTARSSRLGKWLHIGLLRQSRQGRSRSRDLGGFGGRSSFLIGLLCRSGALASWRSKVSQQLLQAVKPCVDLGRFALYQGSDTVAELVELANRLIGAEHVLVGALQLHAATRETTSLAIARSGRSLLAIRTGDSCGGTCS